MKKLLFALSIVLLLTRCAPEYTLIVDNQSLYTIKFKMTIGYAAEERVLEPQEKYIHPNPIPETLKSREQIIWYEPKQYVELNYSNDIYTFISLPPPDLPYEPIPAYIYNSLKNDVILSGDGAISSDPLTINAEQEITTEYIITKISSFNAITTNGYPVRVDYNFNGIKYNIILF